MVRYLNKNSTGTVHTINKAELFRRYGTVLFEII